MKATQFIRFGIFLAILSTTTAAAEELKFGYANLERAVNEVDEGAKAKADLKKEFDSKQALLDKKQAEAKALNDAAESQSAALKPEARQAKMLEVQKKVAEVQQLYVSMQQDMMKRQNEVMGNILQKMNTTLQTIGAEGGYTLIFNKSETSLLYGKSSLDLTNELIRRYNEAYGKGSKAPAKKK